MVLDCPIGSAYESELNHWPIWRPGFQYTQSVNSGTVLWKSHNQFELGEVSVDGPVGPSVDSYNGLIFAFPYVYLIKTA